MRTCSIDGCEKPSKARGWCNAHYQRWARRGDPLGGWDRHATPEESFLARTEPIVGDPGCIIWTGTLDTAGYGQINVDRRNFKAHRYAWEREQGSIPDGMQIDHTCWNRACVNVGHLRLATAQQNTWNRAGANPNSTTGFRGVTRNRRGYQARVRADGKMHCLGTFPTIEEAAAVASAKRKELFGEFAGAA